MLPASTSPVLNVAAFAGDIGAAAAAAAQAGGGTLILDPGTYTVAADTTIPADVTLCVPQGADIDINSGVTLTVAGGLVAGRYPIFAANGTVSFGAAGASLLNAVFPEWFGPGALQTALNAAATSRVPLVLAQTVYDTGAAGLTVDQDYACILGIGWPVGTPSSIPVDEKCAIISYSGTGAAIQVGKGAGGSTMTWTNSILFENFRVLCTNASAIGIDLWVVAGARVEGVTVYCSASASTGVGLRVRGSIDVEIAFADVNGFSVGVQVLAGLPGPSTTITVRKGYLHYCGIGFWNLGSYAELLDSVFESNAKYGLYTSAMNSRTIVTEAWFENNPEHAYGDDGTSSYFENCVFSSYTTQEYFFARCTSPIAGSSPRSSSRSSSIRPSASAPARERRSTTLTSTHRCSSATARSPPPRSAGRSTRRSSR
jgi:hypothetical protein